MSDALRQDTSDKVASAVKPEGSKSTLEQAGDQAKSIGDSIAGTVQPEGEKGIGQKASDFTSGTGTGSGEQGQGVLAQAQEMAGNAAETVKDTLGLNQPKQ